MAAHRDIERHRRMALAPPVNKRVHTASHCAKSFPNLSSLICCAVFSMGGSTRVRKPDGTLAVAQGTANGAELTPLSRQPSLLLPPLHFSHKLVTADAVGRIRECAILSLGRFFRPLYPSMKTEATVQQWSGAVN